MVKRRLHRYLPIIQRTMYGTRKRAATIIRKAARRYLHSKGRGNAHLVTTRMNTPESKYTYQLFPMSATYGFTNTFATVYPPSFATVDLAPFNGTNDNQRVGNSWSPESYDIDLCFRCVDNEIQARFVCFQWLNDVGPDTISTATFPNPVTGSNGQGFNPFFQTPPTAKGLYKILYEQYIDFSKAFQPVALSTDTALHPSPIKVKTKIYKNQLAIKNVSSVNEQFGPSSYTGASLTDATSFRGRIYWLLVTNNFAGADISIAGRVIMNFSDV